MSGPELHLSNFLPEISAASKKVVLQWLEETSGELEAQTKRATTSDTGQTKSSWTHKVDASAMEAVTGSDLENAIWEEYGTGEFAANGDGRQGAWYVPVEAVTGTKKPTYNGQVVIVYGRGGQAYYKTNGKQPKQMLHNAWDKVIPKAKKRLAQKLKEIKQP